MGEHVPFTVATGVQVYFCDPRSPWQRATSEKSNGPLRQYFPKGTNLSGSTQAQLDAVATELNGRPPSGLVTRVVCREIDGYLGQVGFNHCSIKIDNDVLNIHRTFEITMDASWAEGGWGANRFLQGPTPESYWRLGYTSREVGTNGQDQDDFDALVESIAQEMGSAWQGKAYSMSSCGNSNHFVRDVIERAGGEMPSLKSLKVSSEDTPGLGEGLLGWRRHCHL